MNYTHKEIREATAGDWKLQIARTKENWQREFFVSDITIEHEETGTRFVVSLSDLRALLKAAEEIAVFEARP